MHIRCDPPDYLRVLLDQVLTKCGMGLPKPGASTTALLSQVTNHVLGDRNKALRLFVELMATVEHDIAMARNKEAEATTHAHEVEDELRQLNAANHADRGDNIRTLHASAAA